MTSRPLKLNLKLCTSSIFLLSSAPLLLKRASERLFLVLNYSNTCKKLTRWGKGSTTLEFKIHMTCVSHEINSNTFQIVEMVTLIFFFKNECKQPTVFLHLLSVGAVFRFLMLSASHWSWGILPLSLHVILKNGEPELAKLRRERLI